MVVSLTKKKGMSWGMADLRIVCCPLASSVLVSVDRAGAHHLLRSDLGLLALGSNERRTRHDG
jgi:hypothetical protein